LRATGKRTKAFAPGTNDNRAAMFVRQSGRPATPEWPQLIHHETVFGKEFS